MKLMLPDSTERFTETLGQTLLHSLWQGGLIAILLAAILLAARNSSAGFRYRIACLAFFILPLWMTATFWTEWQSLAGHDTVSATTSSQFATTIESSPASFESALPVPRSVDWHLTAGVGWLIGALFFFSDSLLDGGA